jgi:Phenylpropionate dioxygenase and related ring-hydroxylating dioxygenases, large terminal subunit
MDLRGRREEVAAPGDYMAVRICDEPVIVIHGRDGVIRALSNVCRHRGTVMASGRGNKQRIVCPYHHWTYDDAGRLLVAPRLAKRPDFDPGSCRLPEFACTVWQGFVFVSLASDPPALAPRLAVLEDMIRPYHLEQAVLRYVADEVWQTNWKCMLENFMEGYHLSALHHQTLHKVNPTKLCRHSRRGRPISATMPASPRTCRAPRKAIPSSPTASSTIASCSPCRRGWPWVVPATTAPSSASSPNPSTGCG